MLISLLMSLSANVNAKNVNWEFENTNDFYSVNTFLDSDSIQLSYCFIFNKGSKINCDDTLIIELNKTGHNCYSTNKAISSWDNKIFNLSVCLENDNLLWSTSNILNYVPKKITFTKSGY